MSPPWIIVDTPYLCWRSFFAMGHLSHEGVATGVLFGVFRDIKYIEDLFQTNRFVFCFDSKDSLRKEAYPPYKEKRGEKYEKMSEDELRAHAEMRRQVKELRIKHLPEIGYKNILVQRGYEADDMIAMAVECRPREDEAIIVSSDHDMLQLLSKRVSIWNPQHCKMLTVDVFRERYKIEPGQWPDVMALAGCGTDEIEGIAGVGEITAAKFLAGGLKPDSKKYKAICAGNAIWQRNKPLVTLPYPGCNPVRLVENEVSASQRSGVMDSLGFRSMREYR